MEEPGPNERLWREWSNYGIFPVFRTVCHLIGVDFNGLIQTAEDYLDWRMEYARRGYRLTRRHHRPLPTQFYRASWSLNPDTRSPWRVLAQGWHLIVCALVIIWALSHLAWVSVRSSFSGGSPSSPGRFADAIRAAQRGADAIGFDPSKEVRILAALFALFALIAIALIGLALADIPTPSMIRVLSLEEFAVQPENDGSPCHICLEATSPDDMITIEHGPGVVGEEAGDHRVHADCLYQWLATVVEDHGGRPPFACVGCTNPIVGFHLPFETLPETRPQTFFNAPLVWVLYSYFYRSALLTFPDVTDRGLMVYRLMGGGTILEHRCNPPLSRDATAGPHHAFVLIRGVAATLLVILSRFLLLRLFYTALPLMSVLKIDALALPGPVVFLGLVGVCNVLAKCLAEIANYSLRGGVPARAFAYAAVAAMVSMVPTGTWADTVATLYLRVELEYLRLLWRLVGRFLAVDITEQLAQLDPMLPAFRYSVSLEGPELFSGFFRYFVLHSLNVVAFCLLARLVREFQISERLRRRWWNRARPVVIFVFIILANAALCHGLKHYVESDMMGPAWLRALVSDKIRAYVSLRLRALASLVLRFPLLPAGIAIMGAGREVWRLAIRFWYVLA